MTVPLTKEERERLLEWAPQKKEPPGKPYARDGPLRKILVEDSQGNTYEETVG